MNRVLMVLGAIIPALIYVLVEIIRDAMEARDIRKQVEDLYNKSECFNNACSKLADASKYISKALGGNGEMDEIYDDVMRATPINAEAHLVDKSGFSVDWEFANRPLTSIEMHEPSCKCAYCGYTNDHIYGTCDYCGAPLEG